MIAGSLEIQLLANMARLQKDMDDAKRSVGGAMAQIEKSVAQAKAAMVALGGVMSVGMFTGFVQGAIDAADNLNDLSKSTGIAVEQLAGLKLASKQSGGDLEETAKAINKLSVNIAANAEKYAKIGITAKDPLEAFKQLSDVFNRIDDPQKRAAFGAEALGKSWAGAAPLLSEGSDSIQEMVDKGILLSGATQDAADQADEFNDRLAELETMASSVALGIAQDVMPVLTALAESMVKGKEDTDDLALAFPQLSEVLRTFIVLGGNVAFVLNGVGREIGGIAAQAAAMLRGDFSAAFGAGGIGDMMTADAEKSRAAFDKWEEKMMAAGTTAAATAVKVEESAKKETKAQSDATNEFIKGEDAKKKAADATTKALYNQRLEQMALYQKQAEAELESITKQQEEYVKALQSALGPLEQQAQNLEREVENYGLSESAIQLNIIARMEEARAIAAANGAWPEHLNYLDQEIELRKRIATAAGQKETLDTNKKAAEDAAKEWQKFADDIERSLTDALMRSFESGESFGDAFIKNLKNTFKTAALKLVIQTVTGTSGSLVNSAINWAAGTGGSNDGAGTNYLGLANNASTGYNVLNGNYAAAASAAYGYGSTALGYTYGTSAFSQQSMMLAAQDFSMTSIGSTLDAVTSALSSYASSVSTYIASLTASTTSATGTTAVALAGQEAMLADAALTSTTVVAADTAATMSAGAVAGWLALPLLVGTIFASAMGSSVSRLTNTGLTGKFGTEGFDGAVSDEYTKFGGWARDDRKRTIGTPLTPSDAWIQDALFNGIGFRGRNGYGTIEKGIAYRTEQGSGWNMQENTQAEYDRIREGAGAGMADAALARYVEAYDSASKEILSGQVETAQLLALDTSLDTLFSGVKNAVATTLGKGFEDTSFAEKLKGFSHDVNVPVMGDMTAMFTSIGTELTAAMQSFLLPSVATVKTQSIDLANSLKTSLEQATASGDTTSAEALKTKITQLEAVGAETWTQTFGRMMQETQAVAGVLDLFGTTLVETFGKNNMDGILKMSDNLVNLFGGIDAMNTSVNSYYDHFYTQEEKTARSWELMGKSFEALNLTMPTTREGFRDLVDGLKGTDPAFAATFTGLMKLESGFAALVPAIDAVTTTVEDLAKALGERRTSAAEMFTPAKSVQQASQEVIASGLYGSAGDDLSTMSLEGFRAAMLGIINVANDATLTLVEGQSGNLGIISEYLIGLSDAAAQAAADVAALTKSLQDESANLGIELLRAQGDEKGALAAERTIAIDGYNAEQIAIYDTNAATRAYIKTLGEEAAEKDRIAGERKGLQDEYDTLTMTSAQLLNKQRDALDESNRGLFDQINAIKAANTAIEAANTALADLAQQLEAIGGARTNIENAKQGVISQMSTFDAPSYYEAQKAILSAQFSSAGSTDQKVTIAVKWQDAINSGMQAQITALDKARDVRIKALQDESTLAEENASKAKQSAESMASALASIADYANGLKTSNLSTLSPEDKLAAAGSEYQRLLSAAQSGDSDAAGKLTGASDNYLGLAKDYYASTAAYSSIFASVEQSLGSLGSQASIYEQIAATALSTYDLASATAAADAAYQTSVLAIQQSAVDQFTLLDGKLAEYQAATSLLQQAAADSLKALTDGASLYQSTDTSIQSAVLSGQTAANATTATYQTTDEFQTGTQIDYLFTLNNKTDTVGDKITTAQIAITSALNQVAAINSQQAAILSQVTALLAQANVLAAQTATATTASASTSALAGAV